MLRAVFSPSIRFFKKNNIFKYLKSYGKVIKFLREFEYYITKTNLVLLRLKGYVFVCERERKDEYQLSINWCLL